MVSTSQLAGVDLNDAVGKSLNWVDYPSDSIECGSIWHMDSERAPFGRITDKSSWKPSTNWSQGGGMIEQHKIHIWYSNFSSSWEAEIRGYGRHHKAGRNYGAGPTPLIAAMRCFVQSRLGDTL